MSAPKSQSLMDLILPTSVEYSYTEADETVYPFLTPFYLGDYDLEGARDIIAEICEWLNITIGPSPQWSISKSSPWWGGNDIDIGMILLFKTEEDAVAFKLRWS